nr:immunoglobulin heavy chain junction region [Mus musculus]
CARPYYYGSSPVYFDYW